MKNPGIYILTCKVNGKKYVGKDSNMPRRAKEHLSGREKNCRVIHNAIKKYGRDNFDVEYIKYPGISPEALYAVEQWKIAQLNTKSPNGYNLTDGGIGPTGMKWVDESRKKLSESKKGKDPWNKGKTGIYTDETRRKISDSLKGRKGKKHTAETRRKMSENHTRPLKGKDPWNKGKTGVYSIDTRIKISNTLRKKRGQLLLFED